MHADPAGKTFAAAFAAARCDERAAWGPSIPGSGSALSRAGKEGGAPSASGGGRWRRPYCHLDPLGGKANRPGGAGAVARTENVACPLRFREKRTEVGL